MPCLVTSRTRFRVISFSETKAIVAKTLQKIGAGEAHISVHFIGDTMMRRLNRVYRGKDMTTDVLSFSAREGENITKDESDWGDIFLSAPQIIRQSRRFSVTAREETARMLIHGVLHLGGYDHVQQKDAEEMFGIQEELVERVKK